MVRLLLLALCALPIGAAILDRLAITVGSQTITQRQLDEELRVSAFLNHENVAGNEDTRRSAADHLVQQLLVKREMELSHYPMPDAADIEKYLAAVQASYEPAGSFAKELRQYDLTEATLKEHLALQLTTLRFIEFRFRPSAAISDLDIQGAYEREVVAWKAIHPDSNPPSLAQARESIRKELSEERTDEMLDAWLEETRKQVSIIYLDKGLR